MSSTPAMAATRERELIRAAGGGDEAAFGALVETYRAELHAHCYRMLGSVHDAEDAMQEALLRAWRAIGRFEGRSAFRSWMYRIATNTCLDVINRRPKRVLPIDYGPPGDPHDGPGAPLAETAWIEPYPDEGLGLTDGYAAPDARYELRESVELAFVAALQHLPANQRAALILREVLGFSAKEVAETLQTSVPSVNSALQRARATIDDKLPDQTQQATLRALGDDALERIVSEYMGAMEAGDVDRVVALLAEDAAWSMPPLASWFRGLEDLRVFLATGPLTGEWKWKRRATRANGQIAIAGYTWREEEGCYRPFALDVLTLRGDKIAEVTAFIVRSVEVPDPEAYKRWPNQPPAEDKIVTLFERFGLPDRVD